VSDLHCIQDLESAFTVLSHNSNKSDFDRKPALSILNLKKCINKWGKRRTLCKDEQQAQENKNQENRTEPPFLSNLHESPKLAKNKKFCFYVFVFSHT
jgi:hypothetical protein